MSYIMIDVQCSRCLHKMERLVKRPEMDDILICQQEEEGVICQGEVKRVPSAPAINTSDSASFLDGTDRGAGFNKAKEAAKLKVLAADLPHDKREAVQKEIRKLEKI